MAKLSFNSNDHAPAAALGLIPIGEYKAVVVDSMTRRVRSGDGRFLQLAFQIVDGPHKDRVVWTRLHLDSKNATTVRIAEAELAAICQAVGCASITDSTELHGKPLLIDVGTRVRDSGELTNSIKRYQAAR